MKALLDICVVCRMPHVVSELAARLPSTPLVIRKLDNGTYHMQLYESAERTTVKAVEAGNAEYVKQQVADYWATRRTNTL